MQQSCSLTSEETAYEGVMSGRGEGGEVRRGRRGKRLPSSRFIGGGGRGGEERWSESTGGGKRRRDGRGRIEDEGDE